jgi:hypothetical protein
MATKAPATVTELFDTTTVEHRGHSYTFRELSAEEYDKCVDLATSGEGEDKNLDTVQMLRWMITKGSVEPKLSLDDLGKLPFSTVTRLSRAVNDLHFAPDPMDATHACAKCEAVVLDSAEFCSSCGEKQPRETDDEGEEKRPNS